MADAASDDSDTDRVGKLLEALGDAQWHIRREAVGRLASRAASDQPIEQLLAIVRDQHRDLSRLNGALQVLARTEADVVPSLVELLSHADADLRCYVALALGDRHDRRSIEPLIIALDDKSMNVRVHAVEALGKLHALAAVDRLIEVAESGNFTLAFPAVNALATIGDERAADRMLPFLNDPFLQDAVIEALGSLGDVEAIGPLASLLEKRNAPVATIARSLMRIHDRLDVRHGEGERVASRVRDATGTNGTSVILETLRTGRSDELPSLVRLLDMLGGDVSTEAIADLFDRAEVRAQVKAVLLRIGPRAGSFLAARLDRMDVETLGEAIELLSRFGARESSVTLLHHLEADEPEIVVASLGALAKIGDEGAYAAARGFVEHRDESIRHAAIALMTVVHSAQAGSDASAWRTTESPLLREASVRLFAALGGKDAFDAVLASCSDPNDNVRRVAIERLSEVDGERVFAALSTALQSDHRSIRSAAAATLARHTSARAKELLRHVLHDSDTWVRYFAVRGLTHASPSRLTTELLTEFALHDSGVQVRVAATEGLADRPDAFSTLVSLTKDPEPDVAHAAVTVVGQTRDARSPAILAGLLAGADPKLTVQLVRALAATGLDEAVPYLQTVAASSDPSIAATAIEGLGSIASQAAMEAILESNERPAVRERVIATLVKLGAADTTGLARGLHHPDAAARLAVVEALARLRSSEAAAALQGARHDEYSAVRFAASRALARKPLPGEKSKHLLVRRAGDR